MPSMSRPYFILEGYLDLKKEGIMQLYNFYGNEISKKVLSEKEALKRMRNNTLRLVDNLSYNYNREWINIFGYKRPYYYLSFPNDTKNSYFAGYIYIIRNIKTGMAYVGQSDNIIQRKSKHFTDLKNLKHINADMQVDALLYGLNSFTFGIIEFNIPHDALLDKEKQWIKYFNTEYPNGYNAPYDIRIEYNQRNAKEFIAEFIEIKNIRDDQIKNGKDIKEYIDDKIESYCWNSK
jgi:hypothetical protein